MGTWNSLWTELQAGYFFVHFLEEQMARSMDLHIQLYGWVIRNTEQEWRQEILQEVCDWTLKMCPQGKDAGFLFECSQRTTTVEDGKSD